MIPAATGSPPGKENGALQGAVGGNSEQAKTAVQGLSSPSSAVVKARLRLHPLSELFPRMSEVEFNSLKADIAANKLHQAIVTHDGQILDGGNRYRACMELDIEPQTVEYSGVDPVAFVLSANLHRRHLSPGQQAAIVASAQDWAKAQVHGGDRKSDQAATLPVDSVAARVAQSGASDRTQRMADKVAKADPVLAKQVAHGEISLPKAVAKIEPKPQPVPKVTAPEPEPADAQADLLADYEREVAENRALQERIDALTKDDIAAELDKRIRLYQQLEGRLHDALTTSNEAQREATRKGKVLAKIRAALGVERDSEILPRLKGGAV